MAAEIRHNERERRYELHLDGELVGIADYRSEDGALVIPHTEITPPHRGHGLGAQLVRGVLDDVRPTGRKIVPDCWYVAQFIDENPEYADLVA